MIKVIDGMRYNTATATKVAEYSIGYCSDLGYVSEELYVTKKGNYFLFGEGGPASRYARCENYNSFIGGEAINPMSRRSAFIWCQDHDRKNAIDEYFSDLVEDA